MVLGCHDNELSDIYNQLPQWPGFGPIPCSGIGCTVVQTLTCSGTVLVAMFPVFSNHPAQSMNAGPDFLDYAKLMILLSCQSDAPHIRMRAITMRRFGSVESNAF